MADGRRAHPADGEEAEVRGHAFLKFPFAVPTAHFMAQIALAVAS